MYFLNKKNLILKTYLFLFVLLCFSISRYTNFYVPLNDFWGNVFMAQHIEFYNPASYYNGFYPIGYALLLRLFSPFNPVIIGFGINILFGTILIAGIAFLCSHTLGKIWGIICMILVSFQPLVFSHILTPGADIGCTTFTTIGGVLLLTQDRVSKKISKDFVYIISGLLFGFSALIRQHGLVLAFSFLASTILINRQSLRLSVFFFLGLITVYSPQIFVNVLSGHGPFETSQSFNVFKLIHGINWYNTSKIHIPQSIITVIANSPKGFITAYTEFMGKQLYLIIPLLICIFVLKDPLLNKLSLVLIIAFILYIPITSMGGSVRGMLPLLPFFIFSLIILTKYGLEHIREGFNKDKLMFSLTVISVIFFSCFSILLWLKNNLIDIKHRAFWGKSFKLIEEVLVKNEGVTNPKQIFTTSFDLYFLTLESHRPISNGDWERYDLHGYNQEYPEICTDSIDIFLDDCRKHNISHLVIDKNANKLSNELGNLYEQKYKHDQLHVIANIAGLKIFKFIDFGLNKNDLSY